MEQETWARGSRDKKLFPCMLCIQEIHFLQDLKNTMHNVCKIYSIMSWILDKIIFSHVEHMTKTSSSMGLGSTINDTEL